MLRRQHALMRVLGRQHARMRVFGLVMAFLVALPAIAGAPLAVPDAFRQALDSHPAIQQRRSAIEAADLDITAAKWRRFPTLAVEGTLQSGAGDAGSTLRLQQPLWTAGRISSQIDAAEVRRRIAGLALVEAEQDLLARVAQAASDWLRLRERVQVAADNLAEHQRLYGLIERRAAQGVGSAADVALAFARVQQARSEHLTLQASLSTVRSTLEQLIGGPLADGLAATEAPAVPWASAAEVVEDARAFSPSLHRLEAEVALAAAEADARRADVWPQLSARYERFSGSTTSVSAERLLLALEFQPGAGLSSAAARDAAVRRVDAARSAADAGLRDLLERVGSQFQEARAFRDQLEPTRAYVKSATDVMASYLRQYAAGRKSWLEVLNAQREVAQARHGAADTEAGVLLSGLRLHLLTGRLTRATLSSPAGAR